MTRTSIYNRIVLTVILVVTVFHMYTSHVERGRIVDAIVVNQQYFINGLAQIDKTMAAGILRRAEVQQDKNDQQEYYRAIPTPTPQVITKTKTTVKYRKQPTPKPFKLFGY